LLFHLRSLNIIVAIIAPRPCIRVDKHLELGQTTIFGTLNSALGFAKPTLPPRLGPCLKSTSQANTVLGQRLISSQNEKQTIKLFATVQLS
jgi:hypothetical protein